MPNGGFHEILTGGCWPDVEPGWEDVSAAQSHHHRSGQESPRRIEDTEMLMLLGLSNIQTLESAAESSAAGGSRLANRRNGDDEGLGPRRRRRGESYHPPIQGNSRSDDGQTVRHGPSAEATPNSLAGMQGGDSISTPHAVDRAKPRGEDPSLHPGFDAPDYQHDASHRGGVTAQYEQGLDDEDGSSSDEDDGDNQHHTLRLRIHTAHRDRGRGLGVGGGKAYVRAALKGSFGKGLAERGVDWVLTTSSVSANNPDWGGEALDFKHFDQASELEVAVYRDGPGAGQVMCGSRMGAEEALGLAKSGGGPAELKLWGDVSITLKVSFCSAKEKRKATEERQRPSGGGDALPRGGESHAHAHAHAHAPPSPATARIIPHSPTSRSIDDGSNEGSEWPVADDDGGNAGGEFALQGAHQYARIEELLSPRGRDEANDARQGSGGRKGSTATSVSISIPPPPPAAQQLQTPTKNGFPSPPSSRPATPVVIPHTPPTGRGTSTTPRSGGSSLPTSLAKAGKLGDEDVDLWHKMASFPPTSSPSHTPGTPQTPGEITARRLRPPPLLMHLRNQASAPVGSEKGIEEIVVQAKGADAVGGAFSPVDFPRKGFANGVASPGKGHQLSMSATRSLGDGSAIGSAGSHQASQSPGGGRISISGAADPSPSIASAIGLHVMDATTDRSPGGGALMAPMVQSGAETLARNVACPTRFNNGSTKPPLSPGKERTGLPALRDCPAATKVMRSKVWIKTDKAPLALKSGV